MENQIGSHIHVTRVNLNLVKNYIGLIFLLLVYIVSSQVVVHVPLEVHAEPFRSM